MFKKFIIYFFVICTTLFLNINIEAKGYDETINGIKIEKQFINKNFSKSMKNTPKYIVIHDTDNRDTGANAKANRDYFSTTKDKVSAHYLVDESNIIQALDETWIGWHAGERRNGEVSNNNSIAIELCVNGDNNFNKTLENGIELTKHLMSKYNIKSTNVIRHHDVTGKTCPRIMIDDNPNLWSYFKNEISKENTIDGANEENIINNETEITQNIINEPNTEVAQVSQNNLAKVKNIRTTLNVRSIPSKSGKSIAQLKNNQNIKILENLETWVKIEFKENNKTKIGYVHGNYVSVNSV